MKIKPTVVTAVLAGVASAVAWPSLWARFGTSASSGSIELVVATLLVIALPAHAFVVGFGATQASGSRSIDTALLRRIGAWLVAAAVTAGIGAIAHT